MKRPMHLRIPSLFVAPLLALLSGAGAAFAAGVENAVALTRSEVEATDQVYRKHNRKFNEIAKTYAKTLNQALQERKPLPGEPVAEISKVQNELSRELSATREQQIKTRYAKALALHAARSKNKTAKKAVPPDPSGGSSGSTLTRDAEPVRPIVPIQKFSSPANSPTISGEHVPQRLDFSKAGDPGASVPAPSPVKP